MTDFPRGWTLNATQNSSGVAATITVPASPGVIHVLDALEARLINYAGAAVFLPVVSVTTAAGLVLQDLLAVAAAPVSADSVSHVGLDIPSAIGDTIVVFFSGATPAGMWESIVIQGHDI